MPDQPEKRWPWSRRRGSRPDAGQHEARTPSPAQPSDRQSPPAGQSAPAGAETLDSDPKRALHPADDFRRTVVYTVAGTVIPGLGLVAARRRRVGGVVMGIFFAVLLTFAIWALVDRNSLVSLAVRPSALHVLSVLLVVVGLVWVAVVVASHLSLRGRPNRSQRITGGILVGVLAFAVAAPMAVASRYSFDQASLVNKVFKSEKDTHSATRPTITAANPSGGQSADPWADTPRLNILLLGGDAGKDRTGTRTDTVILASIDTKTGDTTLFSLPRNTADMPFPTSSPLHKYYPNGFTTAGNSNGQNAEFFLNAIYGNVPKSVPKDVLGQTDDLGADALKLSVGAATGLKVDYYMLIDLQGFTEMVNALGGVTLNINSYIPIGGNTDRHIKPLSYLHPGKNQHLNGRSTLWYARGRYGSSDYVRMDRQRCVINAIIKQANPANVLARYEKIAQAGGEIVFTDIPQEVLPLLVDLSLRVKNGNVRSIVFKTGYNGFVSAHPNFTQVRARVAKAIGETESQPSKSSSSSPTSSSTKTTKAATTSEDVSDVCAYDPKAAAAAVSPR